MAASLSVSNLIELLGNGVPSALAQCEGAQFRLAKPDGSGYDLGGAMPTADYVRSLVLDGEAPTGRRASNRTITLPVWVIAPDADTLVAARETLMMAADQQRWQLTWTRDGGPALVLDCFRATAIPQYGLIYENSHCSLVTLTIPAKPYGRSDTATVVPFASPVSGGAGPPAPLTLDAYTVVSGAGFTVSARAITGTQSAYWAATGGSHPTYSATFAPADLTGMAALTLWLGLGTGSNDAWYNWHRGPVQVQFTLTDSSAGTVSFGRAPSLVASNTQLQPNWQLVTVPLPSSSAFDWTSVTGYTVTIRNYSTALMQVMTTAVYLNGLMAVPPAVQQPATIRGWVYRLTAGGSARSALSLQVQQPVVSLPQSDVLAGAGTWIPPAGVTSALVECWGGGGAGGSRTTSGLGGGGGGAEYAAEPAYAITGSTPVPYAIGAGGTPAGASSATQSQTFPSGGSSAAWRCPAGVTSLKVQCWGAAGGGGFASSAGQGPGGGGGGEYAAEATLTVVPGAVYFAAPGKGGSGGGGRSAMSSQDGGNTTFTDASFRNLVTAHGGKRGTATSRGAGGTGSIATAHFNGGAGGPSTHAGDGGGGGSSAGTASAGGTGGTGTGGGPGAGGTAPTGGGAGGAGGTSAGAFDGSAPGGGGGGTGPDNLVPALFAGDGADGKVILTWTLSGMGQPAVSGGTTTFGFAGSQVTAHGGTSVAVNATTAGAAGTGSSATAHHDGGAAAAGSGTGGGGGAGADSTGAGAAASGATGGNSALDGGDGGNGGGSANTPGGGGGGADSTGTAEPGGTGAAGMIRVTYTQTLEPFRTLIAHRPGPDAPQSLNPMVSFGGSDPPDGREYPVVSLQPGVNARFGGTYTLWLVAYSWDTPGSPRTVTVGINQYEYDGGPVVTDSKTRTFTPSADASNGMIPIGALTLPVSKLAPDNTSALFTGWVTDSNPNDLFLDLALIDSLGQTTIISTPTDYTSFWSDEPDDSDLGNVLGSYYDRSQATSVLASTLASSGGPLTVYPGDNALFLYSKSGAPAAYASYYERWMADRTAT